MSKEERKKEEMKHKVIFSIAIGIILFVIYLLDYDFNNSFYNGLITFVLSTLMYGVLVVDAYYIETGKHPTTKNEDDFEHLQLFNRMHPFTALYGKLLATIFVIMLIISAVMIIISFF